MGRTRVRYLLLIVLPALCCLALSGCQTTDVSAETRREDVLVLLKRESASQFLIEVTNHAAVPVVFDCGSIGQAMSFGLSGSHSPGDIILVHRSRGGTPPNQPATRPSELQTVIAPGSTMQEHVDLSRDYWVQSIGDRHFNWDDGQRLPVALLLRYSLGVTLRVPCSVGGQPLLLTGSVYSSVGQTPLQMPE